MSQAAISKNKKSKREMMDHGVRSSRYLGGQS